MEEQHKQMEEVKKEMFTKVFLMALGREVKIFLFLFFVTFVYSKGATLLRLRNVLPFVNLIFIYIQWNKRNTDYIEMENQQSVTMTAIVYFIEREL